jgi:hypothetical protein
VEEQFYIVCPLLLLLLFKFARKSVLPVLGTLAVLSLAYSCYGVERSPEQTFFSTFGRAWELGIGTLLAFASLPVASRRWAVDAEAAAGLGMIACSYFLYDDATPFPGFAAVPLCLGAALIIRSGITSQTSVVAQMLSSRLMAGIGLISYSVYLWHWPLLVLCLYRFPDVFGADAPHEMMARIGLALASLGLGALSWRFIEEPFRRAKSQPRSMVFAAGTVVTLAIGALSAVVMERPHWLQSWPAPIDAMQFRKTVRGRALGLKRQPGWTDDTYLIGKDGSTPDTVLWGDSFAQALIPGFITYHHRTGEDVVVAARPGCPPLLNVEVHRRSRDRACGGHNDTIFRKITSPEIAQVILVSRWPSFARGRLRGGEDVQEKAAFVSALEATVRRLIEHNKKVVIVGPIPSQSFDVAPAMARHIAWGLPLPPELTLQEFLQDERVILPVLARLASIPHVRVVYPHLSLCDAKVCHYSTDSKPMYSDDGHLSPDGVATLSNMFDELFGSSAKS